MTRKTIQCVQSAHIDPDLAARSYARAYHNAVSHVIDYDAIQRTLTQCVQAGLSDEKTTAVVAQAALSRTRAVIVRPSAKVVKGPRVCDTYTRHLDTAKKAQNAGTMLAHEQHEAGKKPAMWAEIAHDKNASRSAKRNAQAKLRKLAREAR